MKKLFKKKIKYKIGDVFQITLPNGRYAYGRVYNDASVGIYKRITNSSYLPPVGSHDFLFNVGMYDDILTTGKCPIVGHDPFDEHESIWPPANCIIDPITGEYSIYFQGQIREASEA